MSMHNQGRDTPQRQFTGRHMLAIMLAFFGVIIAVNLTMATLASRSWTGLEVKNSYVASQDYNAKLAVADRQHARGWKSSLRYGGDTLTLTMTNAAGDALRGAGLTALLKRPVHENDDRPLDFHEASPGIFEARASMQPGAWDVDVRLNGPGGEPYRQVFRLLVKE